MLRHVFTIFLLFVASTASSIDTARSVNGSESSKASKRLTDCSPISILKTSGNRVFSVRRSDGRVLEFSYDAQGRLSTMQVDTRRKVFFYQATMLAPYMIRFESRQVGIADVVQDTTSARALKAVEIINRTQGRDLYRFMKAMVRAKVVDSKIAKTGSGGSSAAYSLGLEEGPDPTDPIYSHEYDYWVDDLLAYYVPQEDIPSLLVCQTPISCAICLGACRYITNQARAECDALWGDDKTRCLINSGRDELICGLACL
ncbi:hypothetical protein [Pelomonas sp. SE-A7]|uniref:hypothetical protein n=1 Tax=Pelomonas sp. SE-A7 TaxID=3054953 RepID=UPI00259CD536|nr:hypothetical protein [Pelomonas sp. SE-A7]MDM4766622.1 hypothetical protein [Pelomonas sp. SE-A7]